MGRLIDADKLLETLQDLEPHCENKDFEYGMSSTMNYYMPKIINDEPTAYDANKVVEKLEQKMKRARDKEQENTSEYFEGEADGFEFAIEIVKGGGVDNG